MDTDITQIIDKRVELSDEDRFQLFIAVFEDLLKPLEDEQGEIEEVA